jgi:triosephosphate isomerase
MQLIAGNWKMNGLLASRKEVGDLVAGLKAAPPRAEVLVCPPATLLHAFAPLVEGTPVRLGGQTCHPKANGAHTGDISADMLTDAGASHVIVGHSERRTDHQESSPEVAEQSRAAWRAGLSAIVCIGESDAQRSDGMTEEVLAQQIDASVCPQAPLELLSVAYEPIWAIGTGRTASLGDIETAHNFIRARLEAKLGTGGGRVRILYGGSVKPSNAAEILGLASVGGVLVGGASLKAEDFLAIIAAARAT